MPEIRAIRAIQEIQGIQEMRKNCTITSCPQPKNGQIVRLSLHIN